MAINDAVVNASGSLTVPGSKLIREQRFAQGAGPIAVAARWLFLLLVCAYFALSYAALPLFLQLPLYTQGLERTPYQYRALPMYLFRLLSHIQPLMRAGTHVGPLDHDPYRLLLAIIAFFGTLVAVRASSATIRLLTGDSVFAFWSSLLVVWMMQFNVAYSWDNPFTTPYDVTSVMFFCLALLLLLKRQWWAYYAVFVLAVINREAACFITVMFLAWEWTRAQELRETVAQRLRWIAPHVLLQAGIWLAIKFVLARRFASNPGAGLFVTHFVYNVKELFKPQQWPLLLSVCGFTLPVLWVQRRWIGVKELSASMALVFPLSFAGLMIVGVIVEIRIFADWIALAAPAVALVIWNRFRPVSA